MIVYRARDLTVFKITGDAPAEKIMAALESYYHKGPTQNSLWDFSEGSLASFSLQGITRATRRSMALASQHKQERQQGKTVAVAPKDIDFGILKQYIALAEESPHQLMVCRNLDQAWQWLEEK